MPLGDGTGPPEGTGRMTGRGRLAEACRGLRQDSSGKRSLWPWALLALLGFLAFGIVGRWLARKKR